MMLNESTESSLYKNRRQAGKHLARKLLEYKDRPDVIVLGLPRGGVPVAYEVAHKLNAPLDIFVVRKLGVPGQEELAMGAIAHNNVTVFNDDIIAHVTRPLIDTVVEKEKKELETREKKYRGNKPFPKLIDHTVILVDDGLATGASMKAAVKALRQFSPSNIVVAVPVAPPETCQSLKEIADHVICAITPRPFYGVGMWYEDFSQTTDDEVLSLLNEEVEVVRRDAKAWM